MKWFKLTDIITGLVEYCGDGFKCDWRTRINNDWKHTQKQNSDKFTITAHSLL